MAVTSVAAAGRVLASGDDEAPMDEVAGLSATRATAQRVEGLIGNPHVRLVFPDWSIPAGVYPRIRPRQGSSCTGDMITVSVLVLGGEDLSGKCKIIVVAVNNDRNGTSRTAPEGAPDAR